MDSLINPGDLIQTSWNLCILRADQSRWDSVQIERGSYLFCVEEMDMTKEWSAAADGAKTRAALRAQERRAARVVRAASAVAWVIRMGVLAGVKQAKEEFETTGRIKGFKFMTPNGEFVWVSQHDIKILKQL